MADLGDFRRSARLVGIATLVATTTVESQAGGPDHDPAAARGCWRFIERASEHEFTSAKIMALHRQRTIERMRTQKTVLCVQGGTDISHSTGPECRGLEVIGCNQTSAILMVAVMGGYKGRKNDPLPGHAIMRRG